MSALLLLDGQLRVHGAPFITWRAVVKAGAGLPLIDFSPGLHHMPPTQAETADMKL